VDASWDQSTRTSLAYLAYTVVGVLTWAARSATNALYAFTVEAMDVDVAIRHWVEHTVPSVKLTICTDCRTLVQALEDDRAGQCPS
jgi:hypothetical protein